MENNKKTLVLSIIGILVLVIAVIGVSFAMFTFSGTGTKTNVIQTGTISMDFDDASNYFELENSYPMSDGKGIANDDNNATFGVTAEWGTSTMTINYDLIMSNVVEGDTLTADYIKVALKDASGNVIVGNANEGTLTSGVKVSTLTPYNNQGVKGYKLTSGTITTSGTTDTYTILAYVSDDYDLPVDNSVQKAENQQIVQTKSETFSFKISIVAVQQ